MSIGQEDSPDAAANPTENTLQEKLCLEMIAALSEDEKEKAARTSYRYFASTRSATPSQTIRDEFALKMARRHLVAEKGHKDRALKRMRATIQYRDDMNVDVIRQCFYVTDFADDDQRRVYLEHRENLERELSEAKIFVRGESEDGHALYVVITHNYVSGFDPEWYMKYNIYTLERALACTERATDGAVEKVVVVFDFSGYSAKLRPPMSLSKELQFCLRDHYPERVQHVILLDTPFIFRAFWMLMRPFIDHETKNKIKFVTGDDQKEEVVGSIISEENAMPFMRPGGKLVTKLDMKSYLYDTPFDCMCAEAP